MIKEILSVFKSDSLMQQAYDKSFQMLDLTNKMYLEAKEVLREKDHVMENVNIDDQDSEVNKYQRVVRKDVFKHLMMAGTDELASGMALVSVVIDLERIGDYTKNIVEVAANHKDRLRGGKYEEDLKKVEETVTQYFEKTIECFKESDETLGLELVMEYGWVPKLCDQIITSLVKGEDETLNSGSAVALTLYFRSLKRIFAHLRNVNTSIVNPFHRIGFKPKKKWLATQQ